MDYSRLASDDAIARASVALAQRNIKVSVVKNREEARSKLLELVPQRVELYPGVSSTRNELGYEQ